MGFQNIHIIGGGLAGLSLAIALRKAGVPVVVSEAGDYPRHRVCGEFISGVADEVLERLGIAEAFEGSLRPRSLSWMSGGRIIYQGSLPEAARAISRHRLDDRLARQLIAAGGELRTRERIDAAVGEGRVRTSGRDKTPEGTRIGLKAHVRGIELRTELEMHLAGNGYAGLVEIEDGWINVCGIFKADRTIRGRGIELLSAYLEAGGHRGLAASLRSAQVREGSFCAVAGFEPGRQTPREGELCVGDAERMIPPFTGNGMSMAFEAADTAFEPLLAWSRGHANWQAACNRIRSALAARFRTRMCTATMAEPMLSHDASREVVHLLLSRNLIPFSRVYPLFS